VSGVATQEILHAYGSAVRSLSTARAAWSEVAAQGMTALPPVRARDSSPAPRAKRLMGRRLHRGRDRGASSTPSRCHHKPAGPRHLYRATGRTAGPTWAARGAPRDRREIDVERDLTSDKRGRRGAVVRRRPTTDAASSRTAGARGTYAARSSASTLGDGRVSSRAPGEPRDHPPANVASPSDRGCAASCAAELDAGHHAGINTTDARWLGLAPDQRGESRSAPCS